MEASAASESRRCNETFHLLKFAWIGHPNVSLQTGRVDPCAVLARPQGICGTGIWAACGYPDTSGYLDLCPHCFERDARSCTYAYE